MTSHAATKTDHQQERHTMSDPTKNLTALGGIVRGSLTADDLETFPAPGVQKVIFETTELTAFCPVTSQPDIYRCTITYEPDGRCVESKTLKLYLQSFRDIGIFCETLTATIADDLTRSLTPHSLSVTLVQQVRGGLVTTATANRGAN